MTWLQEHTSFNDKVLTECLLQIPPHSDLDSSAQRQRIVSLLSGSNTVPRDNSSIKQADTHY